MFSNAVGQFLKWRISEHPSRVVVGLVERIHRESTEFLHV
jgi:hypothetical protein